MLRSPRVRVSTATGSAGETRSVHSTAVFSIGQCWPNMVSFNVLGRWQCGNLTGYGKNAIFFEMSQLTALNADLATRALAGVAG